MVREESCVEYQVNFLEAGNIPFDLRREEPIRPNDLDENQVCEVDDEEQEISFWGKEVDRLKATDEGNQFENDRSEITKPKGCGGTQFDPFAIQGLVPSVR